MSRDDVARPIVGRKPMAILDRDGVLNVDVGFPYRPDQIIWTEGIFDALARLERAGYRVVVVTNQSGVARGLYTEDDVNMLHHWMAHTVAANGGRIDAFYYCPFHPEGTIEAYRSDHPDRKPAPGMILRALADHPTDRKRSFLIGDRDSDIHAAATAGLRGFKFEGGNLDRFITGHLNSLNSALRESPGI